MRSTPRELWLQFWHTSAITLVVAFVMSFLGLAKLTPIWASTLSFGFSMPLARILLSLIVERVRFRSFVLTVLAHATSVSLCFGGAFFFSLFLCVWAAVGNLDGGWRNFLHVAGSRPIGYSASGAVAIAFIITGIANFSKKLGHEVFWNWVTGYYHEPKEEIRFFMFLDLKDSTTLAEQLGDLKFSALVRDFFQDVSRPCFETRAVVSHYIGDEVVLSWKPGDGRANRNCVRYFFLVKRSIEQRADYYRSQYGHVPEFKAGLHLGSVVATEVGESKSEIVFHGDVMNTTARITGLCGTLGCDFLISKGAHGAAAFDTDDVYHVTDFGEQHLKGREKPVVVFGLQER